MKSILIIIQTLLAFSIAGQSYDYVRYIQTDCKDNCEKTVNSKRESLEKDLSDFKNTQILKGFLEFSIDSIATQEKSVSVFYKRGVQYQIDQLNLNIDSSFLELNKRKVKSIYQLEERIIRELSFLENNGFPFAQVQMTLNHSKGQMLGDVHLDRGALIILDSIIINNPDVVNRAYIQNYLGIRKGAIYSEKTIQDISRLMVSNRFIGLNRSPALYFTPGKATLELDLKNTNASRFDGLVGILPNSTGKTIITGQINLNLINQLRRGEEMQFRWERLNESNQELNLDVKVPYLLKSRFGLQFRTNIYRQDSTINRISTKYGVVYQANTKINLGVGYESGNSNTNSSDLSNFSNTKAKEYFAEVSFQNLDFLLNPRKGLSANSLTSIGSRTISAEESASKLSASAQTQYFLPIWNKSSVKIEAKGATTNSLGLFENELPRIGGIESIRGVNNKSISTSSWLTLGVEYRFLFDRFSNLFLFGENNWSETKLKSSYSRKEIKAFGIGFAIGTKSGVFNFSYGLSDSETGRFELRNAKINFGFSSIF